MFTNKSGSALTAQSDYLRYLTSMYPAGSKIATGIPDKVDAGLNIMVGGTSIGVHSKIAAVDRALLTAPTGVLTNDVNTLRDEIVDVRLATVQADVAALKTKLGGSGSLEARIGDPAAVAPTTGLASLVRNNNAFANGNGFITVTLEAATNVYAQLQEFLALFNQGPSGDLNVTLPKAPYNNLQELVAALNHTP